MRLVTRGEPFNLRNLALSFSPPVEQHTAGCDNDPSRPIYAQVISKADELQAQLTFLVASPDIDQRDLALLLEELISHSGKWGKHYITCDLPADSPHLAGFKQAGFLNWANQVIFRLAPEAVFPDKPRFVWRTWNSGDVRAMTSLYRGIVPGLFQPIEPLTRKTSLGLVLYHPDGGLSGYADLDYGPKGVWVQPVLSPEANDPMILGDLQKAIPNLNNRPIFLAARSYQPWLSSLAQKLLLEVQGEQRLLVRYLMRQIKVEEAQAFAVYEGKRAEGGLPFSQFRSRRN